MVKENPRSWDTQLSEALWAYRTSQRSSTGITPFMLTYGHDAVLPMEVTVRSARRALQNQLHPAGYTEAMIAELEEVDEVRLSALDCLIIQKNRAARAYNKRVKTKSFCTGDLVWKAVLPLGEISHRYGKWSVNWEGPFMVESVLKGWAYQLQDIDGESHVRSINGRYLKQYHPTLWETIQIE